MSYQKKFNYLYISFGDGGSAGDPEKRGQDLNSLLGKILRIDVKNLPYQIPLDNPFYNKNNVKKEIWNYGLRNVWRFSFDRDNGDINLSSYLKVVEEKDSEEEKNQILIDEAKKINPEINLGEFIIKELPPFEFGRVAAQNAKGVIIQKYVCVVLRYLRKKNPHKKMYQ